MADVSKNAPSRAELTPSPPTDLLVAGAAWLLIMILLDVLILGWAPSYAGLRLLALLILGWWALGRGRVPGWIGWVWLGLAALGQVVSAYGWAGSGAGPVANAGGMLAGLLLLPIGGLLLRPSDRAAPRAEMPGGVGVPLPVLRMTADGLLARLQAVVAELDGISARPASPAQSIQLRLLRNELSGIQMLVRQRLTGGEGGLSIGSSSSVPPAMLPPAPLPVRPPAVRSNGLAVLVVDDDPVGRTLTRLLLERAGYAVEETDDAKMALEMALMDGPDLVLAACRLGRHRGLALAWTIRRGGGPPVVLMRGRLDLVSPKRQRQAGIAGLIDKPVTEEGLSSVLDRLLARPVAAAPLSPPPLDASVLHGHLGILGAERVAAIIDSFGNNAPATLAAVSDALAADDIANLGRAAHKLASGALTVGLSALATLAKNADTAAKQGRDQEARDAAIAMTGAFAAGMAALAAFRRDHLNQVQT